MGPSEHELAAHREAMAAHREAMLARLEREEALERDQEEEEEPPSVYEYAARQAGLDADSTGAWGADFAHFQAAQNVFEPQAPTAPGPFGESPFDDGAPPLPAAVARWEVEDVCGWALTIGLPPACLIKLRDALVDGAALLELSSGEIEHELGFPLGARKALLRQLGLILKQGTPSNLEELCAKTALTEEMMASATVQQVQALLREHKVSPDGEIRIMYQLAARRRASDAASRSGGSAAGADTSRSSRTPEAPSRPQPQPQPEPEPASAGPSGSVFQKGEEGTIVSIAASEQVNDKFSPEELRMADYQQNKHKSPPKPSLFKFGATSPGSAGGFGEGWRPDKLASAGQPIFQFGAQASKKEEAAAKNNQPDGDQPAEIAAAQKEEESEVVKEAADLEEEENDLDDHDRRKKAQEEDDDDADHDELDGHEEEDQVDDDEGSGTDEGDYTDESEDDEEQWVGGVITWTNLDEGRVDVRLHLRHDCNCVIGEVEVIRHVREAAADGLRGRDQLCVGVGTRHERAACLDHLAILIRP